MAQKRNKVGRPTKLTPEVIRRIYALLSAGCSLQDAADVCGVSVDAISRLRKSDANFAAGIDRSVAAGKSRLIRKIGKAAPWQAAAWLLERKWPKEFAKVERQEHDHDGTVKIVVEYADGTGGNA